MRTAARECVLKYLYAERINDECGGQLFESLLKDDKLKEEDRAFARACWRPSRKTKSSF